MFFPFYVWDDPEYFLRLLLQSLTVIMSYKWYMAHWRGRRDGVNTEIAREDFKGLLGWAAFLKSAAAPSAAAVLVSIGHQQPKLLTHRIWLLDFKKNKYPWDWWFLPLCVLTGLSPVVQALTGHLPVSLLSSTTSRGRLSERWSSVL